MPRSSAPLRARPVRQPILPTAVGPLLTAARTPLLTVAEERELGMRIQIGLAAERTLTSVRRIPPHLQQQLRAAVHDATIARNALVVANLRLAFYAAQRYASDRISVSDLVQEGVLGLIDAAERYDPTFRARFATYAVHWICKYIRLAIKEAHAAPQTFSAIAADDRAQEHIAQSRADDPPDDLLEAILARSIQADTQRIIARANLSTIEQYVLAWRYNGDGRGVRTPRAIGRHLGLSAAVINAIEGDALAKLRSVAQALNLDLSQALDGR